MCAKLELYEINLQTEIAPALFNILSPEEQQFAATMRNEMLKKKYITVRIALRQILATYLNQSEKKIAIAKTEFGKPYLPDYPEIQFNISHSADILLIVISSIGTVGVDIEKANLQRQNFSGLVTKCFAKSEIDYWNKLPESEKIAEFYRFWTRKEAFVKAVGRGLAIGLQECELVSGISPYFSKIPESYGQSSDWRLFDLSLANDLYGALVIESQKLKIDFVLPIIKYFLIPD